MGGFVFSCLAVIARLECLATIEYPRKSETEKWSDAFVGIPMYTALGIWAAILLFG